MRIRQPSRHRSADSVERYPRDESELDVAMIGYDRSANAVPVVFRFAVEILVAAGTSQRRHAGHPEVVGVRALSRGSRENWSVLKSPPSRTEFKRGSSTPAVGYRPHGRDGRAPIRLKVGQTCITARSTSKPFGQGCVWRRPSTTARTFCSWRAASRLRLSSCGY